MKLDNFILSYKYLPLIGSSYDKSIFLLLIFHGYSFEKNDIWRIRFYFPFLSRFSILKKIRLSEKLKNFFMEVYINVFLILKYVRYTFISEYLLIFMFYSVSTPNNSINGKPNSSITCCSFQKLIACSHAYFVHVCYFCITRFCAIFGESSSCVRHPAGS